MAMVSCCLQISPCRCKSPPAPHAARRGTGRSCKPSAGRILVLVCSPCEVQHGPCSWTAGLRLLPLLQPPPQQFIAFLQPSSRTAVSQMLALAPPPTLKPHGCQPDAGFGSPGPCVPVRSSVTVLAAKQHKGIPVIGSMHPHASVLGLACLQEPGQDAWRIWGKKAEIDRHYDVAGTPARLIRERYRKAAELAKVRGKLSCLLINDIDAGLGHFENTQVTVNNQMVVGRPSPACPA